MTPNLQPTRKQQQLFSTPPNNPLNFTFFEAPKTLPSLASPSVPPCRGSFEAPGIRKHRHAKAPNKLQVLPYAFLHLETKHAGQYKKGWKLTCRKKKTQFPVTGDSGIFWRKIEKKLVALKGGPRLIHK